MNTVLHVLDDVVICALLAVAAALIAATAVFAVTLIAVAVAAALCFGPLILLGAGLAKLSDAIESTIV